MRDLGTGAIPTGYKLMRRVPHISIRAPPWIKWTKQKRNFNRRTPDDKGGD